jgi:hypothetical protein
MKRKSKTDNTPRAYVWKEEIFFFECPLCERVNRLETRPNHLTEITCRAPTR